MFKKISLAFNEFRKAVEDERKYYISTIKELNIERRKLKAENNKLRKKIENKNKSNYGFEIES